MNFCLVVFLLVSQLAAAQSLQVLDKKKQLSTSNDAKPAQMQNANPGNRDRRIEGLARLFEQGDAIHREAWWVLGEERRSKGKSPFGKIHRALLSSQNIKLSNKAMFRCDRYFLKKQALPMNEYPLTIEVFENCSVKEDPKLISKVQLQSDKGMTASFYPENLEEVLGLGPSILNRTIKCEISGNESGQIEKLSCKDWSQDRSKTQMIRLDEYEYEKGAKILIKLRGKVFENLTDVRKIVADVPASGKIEVLETELYPPQEDKPKKKLVPQPSPAKVIHSSENTEEPAEPVADESNSESEVQHAESGEITPLPPPRGEAMEKVGGSASPAVEEVSEPIVEGESQKQNETSEEDVKGVIRGR